LEWVLERILTEELRSDSPLNAIGLHKVVQIELFILGVKLRPLLKPCRDEHENDAGTITCTEAIDGASDRSRKGQCALLGVERWVGVRIRRPTSGAGRWHLDRQTKRPVEAREVGKIVPLRTARF